MPVLRRSLIRAVERCLECSVGGFRDFQNETQFSKLRTEGALPVALNVPGSSVDAVRLRGSLEERSRICGFRRGAPRWQPSPLAWI